MCAEAEKNLDVMIQVNVSGEDSKAGVAPREALKLAAAAQELPLLTVMGFMTIGLNSPDEEAVRAGYARLAALRDEALIRVRTRRFRPARGLGTLDGHVE